MASRKNLLIVYYHYDDDTGMHRVGEIDAEISSNLPAYIEIYGESGAKDILAGLAYLSRQVQQELYNLNKKQRSRQELYNLNKKQRSQQECAKCE